LELSPSKWLVTSLVSGTDKLSKHLVPGGDCGALLQLLAALKAKAEKQSGTAVVVATIQEAGLDGFSLHRLLEANGVESWIVDPSSVAAPRRARRAKSDAIDGETLLRTLLAYRRGEPRVCSMVHPTSPHDEDRRRLTPQPARLRAEPLVRRGPGKETARRTLEVCKSRRSARGSRPEVGVAATTQCQSARPDQPCRIRGKRTVELVG